MSNSNESPYTQNTASSRMWTVHLLPPLLPSSGRNYLLVFAPPQAHRDQPRSAQFLEHRECVVRKANFCFLHLAQGSMDGCTYSEGSYMSIIQPSATRLHRFT